MEGARLGPGGRFQGKAARANEQTEPAFQRDVFRRGAGKQGQLAREHVGPGRGATRQGGAIGLVLGPRHPATSGYQEGHLVTTRTQSSKLNVLLQKVTLE